MRQLIYLILIAAITVVFFSGSVKSLLQQDKFNAEVKAFQEKLIHPGYNLVGFRKSKFSALLDFDGNIHHQWESTQEHEDDWWYHVEMDKDLNLYAIVKDFAFEKYDRNSNLLWRAPGRFHHDIFITESDKIWILKRKVEKFESKGKKYPILADYLCQYSGSGKELLEIPLLPILKKHIPSFKTKRAQSLSENELKEMLVKGGGPGDLLHINSIDVLPFDIPDIGNTGDILLNISGFNAHAVIDPESQELKWFHQYKLYFLTHDLRIINKNLFSLFVNGVDYGRSRILFFNPQNMQAEWEYSGNTKHKFYTKNRGRAALLPNKNILITSSDKGRLIEITSTGEVAWDFTLQDEFIRENGITQGYRVNFDYTTPRIYPEDINFPTN